jgi:uncharacterized protein (DUF736 family)
VHAGRWRRLSDAIEAAIGRRSSLESEIIMAQIGSFTRDENGAFTGTIRTLTLNAKATITPCSKDSDKAPDYRVTAGGGVEFGAGWSKMSREDRPYVSLKFDDPSLAAPIFATLVEGEGGQFNLIWSR